MNIEYMESNGATRVPIYISALDGKKMQRVPFLFDTGATRTSINKIVPPTLGYTDEWISKNKVILSLEEKPTLADGRKLDAYGIPALKLTIGMHEIHHTDYFLTSDAAPKLGFLLGADILSYFDVFFKYSERRTYYGFRKDRVLQQAKPGDTFAYNVN